MKVILFSLAVLGAGSVYAQLTEVPAFPKLPKKFRDEAARAFNYSRIQKSGTINLAGNRKPGPVVITSNGYQRGYIILPQDNMACVIPGNQHYRMPDGRDNKALMQQPAMPIPNPAKPIN